MTSSDLANLTLAVICFAGAATLVLKNRKMYSRGMRSQSACRSSHSTTARRTESSARRTESSARRTESSARRTASSARPSPRRKPTHRRQKPQSPSWVEELRESARSTKISPSPTKIRVPAQRAHHPASEPPKPPHHLTEPPSTVPNGLQNLGNTCFLNASTQALLAVPAFVRQLRRSVPTDHPLLALTQDDGVTKSSRAWYVEVVKHLPRFRGYGQHDAHEAVMGIVDMLPRAVQKIFETSLVTTTACPACSYQTQTKDAMGIVTLDMNATSLDEAWNRLDTGVETAEGWRCDDCHQVVNARKSGTVPSLPSVVCIHWKRWSPNRRKDARPVPAPLRWRNKKLYSVVVHGGNVRGGHYVAYVRRGPRWYHISDSHVSPVDNITDQLRTGYLMFYA